MLTSEEKTVAKMAIYFGGNDSWGKPAPGGLVDLWPAAMVAQLRGVKFEFARECGRNDYNVKPVANVKYDGFKAMDVALNALEDVMRWLGYDDNFDYLAALDTHGKEIFDLRVAFMKE